jgi:hypothetical protein
MTRGTECKCSSLEVNGLIQVRRDTLLLESDSETPGKEVEIRGSKRVIRGTLLQGCSQPLDTVCHMIVAKDLYSNQDYKGWSRGSSVA